MIVVKATSSREVRKSNLASRHTEGLRRRLDTTMIQSNDWLSILETCLMFQR